MCHKPPIPAKAFAKRLGLPYRRVVELCRDGRVFGAQKDVRSHRWWIHPPGRIISRDVAGPD